MAAHPTHPRGSARKPKRAVSTERRRVAALEEAVEQLQEGGE